MSTEKNYTVAEVAMLPDEPGWVNGSLAAHVLKIETIAKKAGGQFWKATLGDAPGDYTGCVSLSLFMAPKFQQGDQIRLGGGGIKKSSYQGKAQISLGKSSTVEVILGTARLQAGVSAAMETNRANTAQQANEGLINGQSVGMAIKEALSLQTFACDEAQVRQLTRTPAFWQEVHETASDILRLAQLLEKGKLAAPIRERAGKPAGRPQHDPASELDAEEPQPF